MTVCDTDMFINIGRYWSNIIRLPTVHCKM